MITRITSYIFFFCGFVTVAFFGNYKGSVIKNNVLFYFIGCLFFLVGWILLRSNKKIKEQNDKKKIRKLIDELKKNGSKITVDLSKCQIKSNDYSEEQERYTSGILATSYESDIQALNNLLGDEMANVRTVDIYQSVLIYKHNYMGKVITFTSGIIPTEHTTLLFKLDNQKTTFIYVDKEDCGKYYFDLEFLAS